MPEKKTDSFLNFSWDDLREWAGSRIVSRGTSYQRQKLVSELAVLDNGGLLAWVHGTHRYATQVTMGQNGLPESICTCPYGCNCKHAVAAVLEYLEQIKKNKRVPNAAEDDERLLLIDQDRRSEDLSDSNAENARDGSFSKQTAGGTIAAFLKNKTKSQLTELILELAEKFPKMGQELTDRYQLVSGDVKSLISRLKKDIRQITSEPGWQNYWEHEGYTPDYSEIRIKLETLLKAGYPDDVLDLGQRLVEQGSRQIEQSDDDGETVLEIASCMPVIVEALDRSSMAKADKLAWAVKVVLKDNWDVFNAFDDYLGRRHAKADWNLLADHLLKRLDKMKPPANRNDFHWKYSRDRLSDWVIYALDQAGREDEIIPLCKVEARMTDSYTRLVKYLIAEKRYKDAEHWIQEGIIKTEKELPGIASDLRSKMKEILSFQKDWGAVAVMQTEEFVCRPSAQTYIECKKANTKTKTWPVVRDCLLLYLEKGELPWKQSVWPFVKSNQSKPDMRRNTFPMTHVLIDIAIQEKQPDRVIYWYDQSQRNKRNWNWIGCDEDRVAAAIQEYAPERSVAIWKTIAEGLIKQTNPRAYEQAIRYLTKAEKVMARQKAQSEWEKYVIGLRAKHARKRRFIEVLDQRDGNPIIHIKR